MEREIKFRGYKYPGGWIYGNLIEKDDPQKKEPTPWVRLIHDRALNAELVVFNSVGQFTGHKDYKGNDVYEDDLLRDEEATYRVIWDEETSGWDLLRLEDGNQIGGFGSYMNSFFKDFVSEARNVGTVYENPELLNNG